MKFFVLLSACVLFSCVLIPDREETDSELIQRHELQKEQIASPKGLDSNRAQSLQWYQENINNKHGKFSVSEVEEKGCTRFFVGDGSSRKEIISLFLPDSCEYLYKYFIQSTIQCNSKGMIQFPLTAKGKTIFWKLEGKKGTIVSDYDGRIHLIFASAKPVNINDSLQLSLDENATILLPNSLTIILPDEYCGTS